MLVSSYLPSPGIPTHLGRMNRTVGVMLSPEHQRGKTFTSTVMQLSTFLLWVSSCPSSLGISTLSTERITHANMQGLDKRLGNQEFANRGILASLVVGLLSAIAAASAKLLNLI